MARAREDGTRNDDMTLVRLTDEEALPRWPPGPISPSTTRRCSFRSARSAIPSLQKAQIEKDRFGMPKPATGGNAVVYKATEGQNVWAVRCFLPADHRSRRALRRHLQAPLEEPLRAQHRVRLSRRRPAHQRRHVPDREEQLALLLLPRSAYCLTILGPEAPLAAHIVSHFHLNLTTSDEQGHLRRNSRPGRPSPTPRRRAPPPLTGSSPTSSLRRFLSAPWARNCHQGRWSTPPARAWWWRQPWTRPLAMLPCVPIHSFLTYLAFIKILLTINHGDAARARSSQRFSGRRDQHVPTPDAPSTDTEERVSPAVEKQANPSACTTGERHDGLTSSRFLVSFLAATSTWRSTQHNIIKRSSKMIYIYIYIDQQ